MILASTFFFSLCQSIFDRPCKRSSSLCIRESHRLRAVSQFGRGRFTHPLLFSLRPHLCPPLTFDALIHVVKHLTHIIWVRCGILTVGHHDGTLPISMTQASQSSNRLLGLPAFSNIGAPHAASKAITSMMLMVLLRSNRVRGNHLAQQKL